MFWKKKEKPRRKLYYYDINIQPDITAVEAAKIAMMSARFHSHLERDMWFDSLPPECQRHIKKLEY